MAAAVLLGVLAIGCGQAPTQGQGSEPEPDTAQTVVEPKTELEPQPLARWDTAYERPGWVAETVDLTLKTWLAHGQRLGAECYQDVLETRIEVWQDGADMCWKGSDHGCVFRSEASQRPVIQIQRYESVHITLTHEIIHVLVWCSDADEGPDHTGKPWEVIWPEAEDAVMASIGKVTFGGMLFGEGSP